MAPTPFPKPALTLQDVLDQLTILGTELDEVRRNQDEMPRNQPQGQQGQNRPWDGVVKGVGGLSAGLIIRASIAWVGIVRRQLVQ